MRAVADSLGVELEHALVRELLGEWRRLNASYFRNALRAPALALTESQHFLGRWLPDERTLELSRPFLLSHPWGVVVEVLKHEMAHQYVHEILREMTETAHGNAFRGVCERLGIDPTASGLPPAGAATAGDDEERMVARIAKLLALAESPNQHEAEAAMAAAQRLMLKYNLEQRAAQQRYGFRHLGKPSGRVGEAERLLAGLLGKYFFVEVIWVPVYRPLESKRGSVLEICGTEANLAMAEYVHAYLLHSAEELWRAHKRAARVRGDRDRRTYLAGVMAGFAEKLARQSTEQRSAGLVWVSDGDLSDFYRKRHPHIRNVRYGGQRRTEAFSHGREAGKKLVLRKPIAGAAGSRGRLLGPKGPS
jgi:hypothetical protein